ncbi:oxidoreductase [Fusarium oxysporum f. sp. conglutinans race 2 54008]|uniref:Oxidoreductase n=1 Tax=Fusarium oxysporum f. sp. conglutinans race 2 54008 TaxID=1089457 RepID=X0HTJ5_FUSOX|nr:oxidoreductase [Fusarium oxysporum f. sp. conglutinans race 2 54008]
MTTQNFKNEKDIPVSHQDFPGTEREMPNPKATRDELPEAGGNSRTYQGSGKLKGKKALITGGDSGIGAASALLFGREGVSDIVIAYLPEEEKDAQDTKKQVENEGAKVHLISLDLSKQENCKKLVDFAVEKMNGIDILFNNAAYQMMVQDIKDLPEEQWIHTFNINIHSFFYISKYALPHMKTGATIINNASINAYIGRPDLLDYTSTKGAIVSFTRGLSNQYVGKGIRVNAVAPGPGMLSRSHQCMIQLTMHSLDTSHSRHNGRRSAEAVHKPHGTTCSAIRDCYVRGLPGIE